MSRTTLVLDSSQIDTYLTRARQWQFNYVENLTLSNEVREDFAMGTYGHKLLELYYKGIYDGLRPSQAAEKALAWNPDLETCVCGHSVDDHYDTGGFCQSCNGEKECHEMRPVPFMLSAETRERVRERFNFYWMIYSNGNDIRPAQRAGEPMIEKGFSYPLLDDAEHLFVLEGRIDLVGELSGNMVFMDHKWQGRMHHLYTKSIQFRNYSLVTDLNLGIINYVRLAKDVKKETIQRTPIQFNGLQKAAWREELIGIFKKIAHEVNASHESGNPLLPANRAACAGKWGFPCQYTRMCEETSLIQIEANKKQYYTKKQEWKPW